jgi:regulator of sigma E protease
MIVSILVFLVSLSAVIMIHELGHFIMAKRAGILCHEFSIGMGPLIWSKKKGETVYAIRAIPIGGYVMMAGEEMDSELVKVGMTIRVVYNDQQVIEKIILDPQNTTYSKTEQMVVEAVDLRGKDDQSLHINHVPVKEDAMLVMKNREMQIAPFNRDFESKTVWQRFLAIVAGPFMNFVLALLVFLAINLYIGVPNMDSSEIGSVTPNYPADTVLKEGDVILEINGQSIDDWMDLGRVLDDVEGDRDVTFVVDRDPQLITTLVPDIYFYSIGFHSASGDVDQLEIGPVTEGTLADEAGFMEGDQIVSIDGTTMTSWQDVIDVLRLIADEPYDEDRTVDFVMMRDETVTLTVNRPYTAEFLASQNVPVYDTVVGIGPVYGFAFGQSIQNGFAQLKSSAMVIFTTLQLLFDSDGAGAGIGVGSLSGPVGIFQITSRALEDGVISLFNWIGLLSVNLGIINLLPIPALDGGRLVFLGYEAVSRKKPNKKIENTLHYVMYLALMGLFIYITFNDILRLFNFR